LGEDNDMKKDLADVLRHPAIWRLGDAPRQSRNGLSTGFPQLDNELPEHGWPRGALTELLCERQGIGEVSLMLPALRQVSSEGRHIALIAPPYVPFSRALDANDVRLDRVLVVDGSKDHLTWIAEKIIKSKSCGVVVMWDSPRGMDYTQLRRLHLSAENSDTVCVLYRPARAQQSPSAAPVRMVLSAVDGELCIRIVKRRGSVAASAIRLSLYPSCWRVSSTASKPTIRPRQPSPTLFDANAPHQHNTAAQ
jgi:hypothetical protein